MAPILVMSACMLFSGWEKHQTDTGFLRAPKVWMIVELVLFIIFLPLLYTPVKIIYTVYGLLYLVSLIAALVITVRMRATVEAV